MSYRDMVEIDYSITLDTSNLDTRLEEMQQTLDEINTEGLDNRLTALENAAPQDGALQMLEERIEKLEASRSRDASIVDLLRQLARALIG